MKSLNLLIVFVLFSVVGWGQVTIFSETIGTCCATNNTAIASTTFDNSGLSFSGTADTRTTTASSGYIGASGGRNVFFTNTIGRHLLIENINTIGYTAIALSFGHHKSTNASNNELQVEVSSDGINWSPLSYSRSTGTGTANWTLISPSGTIPSTANLRIKFTQTISGSQFRVDDITLTGDLVSLCTPPTTQASNLSFSNVSDVSMDLNWTVGNGDGRVVIINTSNSFTDPSNTSDPLANATYNGSGEQVVYNGTGNSVSVNGLTPNTAYWFRVYEFCAPDRSYQTALVSNNPNNETTLSCLATNHYFRSVATGNWDDLSTWESSIDEISWGQPACAPDFNANTIRIRNGNIVALNSVLDVDQIIIEDGGVLSKETGADMTLRDGLGDDILIENGGVLEYAGANIPNYQNAGVRMRVETGGAIRVNNNLGGISNNLAGNGSSNRIIYEHESIFEWNNSVLFASSGQVYFPDAGNSIIPTFLLSPGVAINIGAGNPTTINGLFECNGDITFQSAGDKIFRNGIIGSGDVNQSSDCGRFYFSGDIAYLGGTGVINLDHERLNTYLNVNVVLISDKIINTTSGDINTGQFCLANGSSIDMGPYELSGSGNIRLNSDVILKTSHPDGVDGALNGLAVTDFQSPLNQTLEFYNSGAQNSGSLLLPDSCANLITGNNTLLTIEEDIEVSNELTLGLGSIIQVDSGKELYISNSSPAAILGGFLTGSSNYISGSLKWATDNDTYQFPSGFSSFGAQGFEIDVTGSGDVLAYLETNSTSPVLNFAYCDIETSTSPGQQVGQGAVGLDSILDQVSFDLSSALQWQITNPNGGINEYDITLNANGSNDINPVQSADGLDIRYLFKNGEPGDPGVATINSPEFPDFGFEACPNGYSLTNLTTFSTFTINGASSSNTALPVEMLYFNANCDNQKVSLNWKTASELNASHFEVEKSLDGVEWLKIGEVSAGGTKSTPSLYQFNDANRNELAYYRLKQIDFDGVFEYFGPVSARCDASELMVGLFPNPTNTNLNVKLYKNEQTELIFEIFDAQGRKLITSSKLLPAGTNIIPFDVSSFTPGVYVFVLKSRDEVLKHLKFVKQ